MAVYIFNPFNMTGTEEILNPADEGIQDLPDSAAEVEKLRAEKEAAELRASESSKEAKFKNEENKVLRDNTYLVTLAKNDKKMAERIAKDNWGLNLGEALEQLWVSAPAIERKPEDLDEWFENKKRQEKVQETYNAFVTELEMNDDQKKQFETEYQELTEGKELDPSKVKKYAALAWKSITDDDVKEVTKTKRVVSTMSAAWGTAGKETPKGQSFVFPRDNGTESWY